MFEETKDVLSVVLAGVLLGVVFATLFLEYVKQKWFERGYIEGSDRREKDWDIYPIDRKNLNEVKDEAYEIYINKYGHEYP